MRCPDLAAQEEENSSMTDVQDEENFRVQESVFAERTACGRRQILDVVTVNVLCRQQQVYRTGSDKPCRHLSGSRHNFSKTRKYSKKHRSYNQRRKLHVFVTHGVITLYFTHIPRTPTDRFIPNLVRCFACWM